MEIKERSKAGMVGVVGRPSVGKSTLLNCICKAPISITSAVPQTTRNQIRGIYTEERGQIVFLDSPGLHSSRKRFNTHLSALVRRTLGDCDVILYMVDATRAPGKEEDTLAGLLHASTLPYVLVFNKIDHPRSDAATYDQLRKDLRAPETTHYISAKEQRGIDELCTSLFSLLPKSELLYPDDVYTDQAPEFRIAEIVRSQALSFLRQELPHSLYVSLTDVLETTRNEAEEIIAQTVLVTLYVEEESQKGILVGRKGAMIQRIREGSQRILNTVFPHRITLRLRVQRKAKWRSDETLLRKLIF